MIRAEGSADRLQWSASLCSWFSRYAPRCVNPHSFLLYAQRFEAGDDVEQFLVDATLARTVECRVEVLQQFVDVLVGALHRREAARVLARQRFGARSEQRNEKIFADECAQSR